MRASVRDQESRILLPNKNMEIVTPYGKVTTGTTKPTNPLYADLCADGIEDALKDMDSYDEKLLRQKKAECLAKKNAKKNHTVPSTVKSSILKVSDKNYEEKGDPKQEFPKISSTDTVVVKPSGDKFLLQEKPSAIVNKASKGSIK